MDIGKTDKIKKQQKNEVGQTKKRKKRKRRRTKIKITNRKKLDGQKI